MNDQKMMYLWLGCLYLALAPSVVFSQPQDSDTKAEQSPYPSKQIVKTVDNLKFVVEEDRPIEKIGGVYQPASLENYMAMKLDKMDKKMNETDASLEKEIKDLAARVNVLEQKIKSLEASARPPEK